ncbi:hypothetical protein OPV22_003879 [Ensete ventricosum]|uniref:Cytochrome b5 heme-binding domain-containing protein n=1 Tax=Ensete ventricosum TaxID=4639 RepID=A0AAV8S273_ENSVE|nr:hypothetical protein OPV22_003879 [Ensete ventricosum]
MHPGDPEHLLDGVHSGGLRYPPDGVEDVLLGQVLAVEGDVEEEPGGGGAGEVEAAAADELLGEEAEVVGPVTGILLEFHVEDLRHVDRRLLSIPLRRAPVSSTPQSLASSSASTITRRRTPKASTTGNDKEFDVIARRRPRSAGSLSRFFQIMDCPNGDYHEGVSVVGFEVPRSPDSSYNNPIPGNEDEGREPPLVPSLLLNYSRRSWRRFLINST